MNSQHEVIVIGGGQAGLAIGYYLQRKGIDFAILDGAPAVGHSWRTRWDSLRLFTPARYSALPGLPFPGDPERYPGKDDVADYLERYARVFDLPVELDTNVLALRAAAAGGFEVECAGTTYHAAQVVVATGPFQRPAVPSFARSIDPGTVQLHSSEYRRPEQLPAGEVLVVGAGNSGVQIAAELAETRPTTLAVGERQVRLPDRFLGRSIFHWLETTGLMNMTVTSRLGAKASRREFLIGMSPEMISTERSVRLVGRVADVSASGIRTADGARFRPSAIVWATGFRSEYGWVDAPVFDGRGLPIHTRGVTAYPGLYFLGLPWQHTRGSALIGWVGRDAEFLADRIAARAARPASAGHRLGQRSSGAGRIRSSLASGELQPA